MDAVGQLIAEWRAARVVLAELERAEHPDITDAYGRVWAWKGRGDIYTHDRTLAIPQAWIDSYGLPSATLADNPNYGRLCATCRQHWPTPVQLELF